MKFFSLLFIAGIASGVLAAPVPEAQVERGFQPNAWGGGSSESVPCGSYPYTNRYAGSKGSPIKREPKIEPMGSWGGGSCTFDILESGSPTDHP